MPDMDPESRYNMESDRVNLDMKYHGNTTEVKGRYEDQHHGNTLKETDISWEITETLDDIEFPDMDLADVSMQSDLKTDNTGQGQMSAMSHQGHIGQGDAGFGSGDHVTRSDLLSFTPIAKPVKENVLIEFSP